MNRKKISECLAQDISKLADIALGMAGTREKHNQIITLQQCIYAGLGDYELAWRAEVKRVADSVQEGTGGGRIKISHARNVADQQELNKTSEDTNV